MTASDEAKKALEGVTPGPWENVSFQSGTVQVMMRQWNNAKPDPMRDGSMFGYMSAHMTAYNIGWQNENDIDRERQANARFIAWAREGVPALLAEIAAKDAEIARLTAQPSPDVAALVEAAEKLLDAYSAIVGAGNSWGDELRTAIARVKGGA